MYKKLIAIAILATTLLPMSVYALNEESDSAETVANVTERVEAAKKNSKARSTKAKEDAEQRKLVMSQQKCEATKERLVAAVPKLYKSVNTLKTNLDKKFDRVKSIHDDGKLDTPDYHTLVAAVDEAKAGVDTSASLVTPVTVEVDCSVNGLGAQLDSYRSTVKEVRTDLKTYHAALVKLVSAMNASADKTDSQEASDESN